MTIFDRIKKWNEERNLLNQEFNLEVEVLNIVEEIMEMSTNLQSDDARELATEITQAIIDIPDSNGDNSEKIVDALGDIIVYVTGAMLKLGYDPNKVMDEVLQEIESRRGEIIDGKFVKDKSPEAKAKWYKANFSKTKL